MRWLVVLTAALSTIALRPLRVPIRSRYALSVNKKSRGPADVATLAADDRVQLSAEEQEFVDEELVRRVEAEVMAISGVGLEGLMNPATVLNLEKDLIALNIKLEAERDSARREEILRTIQKKTDKLYTEKRTVFRGWLKAIFLVQSVIAGVISLGMVYNAIPGQDLPLSLQVLGFWMWWLFIIPSLRARKPSAEEKDALNIAFLVTPLVSLVVPIATKDTGLLWWANAAAVALCYAYSFTKGVSAEPEDEEGGGSLPLFIRRAINALDYGSGRERGARK